MDGRWEVGNRKAEGGNQESRSGGWEQGTGAGRRRKVGIGSQGAVGGKQAAGGKWD